MKKILLILAISFTSFVFTSCREEAGDVEEGVEEVGEDMEDVGEEIED